MPPVAADAKVAVRAPIDAAAAVARSCAHDPPDITGCGGAEVKLHGSFASCGLPDDGYLSGDLCAQSARASTATHAART